MTPICLNRLILLISILLCVQVHAESLWINADSLKESVGSGNEWDEWQPEEIEGWKYIENFGAFFPWSNWIYHLDHGWLYPVAEDLGSIWFYSLKLNNNWIWTSQNHFDFFFIHKSGGFYFYDKDSRGEFYHDFQNGEWMLWYQLPDLFPTNLAWQFESPPEGMVLIPQGTFNMGGVNKGEEFTDSDNDGEFDSGEPFEDSNGNGEYDGQQGYDDEYPQHVVDLSPFYISQFEVTNQLWDQVMQWAITRPDKSPPSEDNYTYQFDSMEYVDVAIIANAYRKLQIAVDDYNDSPTDRNRSEYDKKLAALNTAIAKRDAKVLEIEEYRNSNPNFPINYVSWSDAAKWCNAYSEMTGRTPVYYVDRGLAGVYRTSKKDSLVDLENGYVKWYADGFRLPTEGEWEKAARGGLDGNLYTTGDILNPDLENIGSTDGQQTVGSFPPNAFGLYDMGGNLQEWCWDWKADYDEIKGSFTLHIPTRQLSAKLVLDQLASISSPTEILEAVNSAISNSDLNGNVTASTIQGQLTLSLVNSTEEDYLYASELDRNAISILGLREMESSLPLFIEAQASPLGSWNLPANFSISIKNLLSGQTTDYSVIAQAPEAGKVLTLYTIVNLLNDGLISAGLDGGIKAGISGDKIRLALEPGQSPATFRINIPAGSPMQSIIGFRDGQESSENADTSVLKVRNQLQPSKAKIDPHGPVDGDRRVFRGGRWDFNNFHSRVSSRSSHLPYLPSKSISFRTVIGLHRDRGI